MARRSPQNPRYQKDSLGKTRRSAASAKPKRAAGDRGSSGGRSSSSAPKPTGWRRFFQPLPMPDTPRFKMWRRIWAGFFAAGIIFTLLALLQWETGIGTWLLVAAYTCLFSAIFIDIVKIRRMRREYADELEEKASGKKSSKQASKESSESGGENSGSKKGDE